jgi:hypothetical protein
LYALVEHAISNAKAVEDFQRPFGETQRAATFPDPVGVVEDDHRLAALREIQGQRQPHRACPHNNHGVMRMRPVLIGRATISELDKAAARIHGSIL